MSHSNLIDERVKVNAAAKAAIVAFRRSKPWRGDWSERGDKFAEFHRGMCEAYGLDALLVRDGMDQDVCSGGSSFCVRNQTITLRGRLSVVTYLHMLCRARGMDHRGACRWSLSIFKRFFPLSFSRCRLEGFMLVRQ